MITTSVFSKNLKAYKDGYRIIVNKGGSRSGKTYSILQLNYLLAEKYNLHTSVVSENYPHLRRGAIKDFYDILTAEDLFDYNRWNKSNSTYKVSDKSLIEFFALDNPGKAHGSARNNLFVNECQNMHYEIVRQLMQRTDGTVWLDYNPTHDFWIEDKILTRSDAILIHSTYKDNECLPENIVKEIEANRNDADWWQVYGLGETGKREGLIYNNWEMVDEFPSGADISYGLDFGFNHPAVLIKVGLYNDCIYLDEVFYRSGLITAEIANICRDIKGIIYADGSRPESIEELIRHGLKVLPAIKGQGSVFSQIQFVKKYPIKVTKRSVNTIKELRNYRWLRDKNDKPIEEPIKVMDDAMDAFRYGAVGKWFRNYKGARFSF